MPMVWGYNPHACRRVSWMCLLLIFVVAIASLRSPLRRIFALAVPPLLLSSSSESSFILFIVFIVFIVFLLFILFILFLLFPLFLLFLLLLLFLLSYSSSSSFPPCPPLPPLPSSALSHLRLVFRCSGQPLGCCMVSQCFTACSMQRTSWNSQLPVAATAQPVSSKLEGTTLLELMVIFALAQVWVKS